ncbi:MAG TPA: hypothetical protein C5S51_10365 [Methanosarcinaceae archaeon]|nr:hypothetical protein [Methanosarcinaceae archaeon]
MQIPIQNIYYLLCYAWNKLDESDIVNVKAISTTNLIDLFAKILINSTARLLKQGLDRNYVEHEYIVNGIKGKLNLSASVKQNILPSSKTICLCDEFDYNILHNQILKTTISKLLKVNNLDKNLKSELRHHFQKLPPISEIRIRNSHFKQIRLHRNNYHYDFVLKVCQIVNENLFIDESSGDYKFKDFTRNDKAMARLFEDFVRNFYNIEQSDFKVKRENIKWKFVSESEADSRMLPIMQTDISLYSSTRKIIIDTKYYKDAFNTRFSQEKFNSTNMYQLFSYLKNQESDLEITKTCEGILLYPTVENGFKFCYKYESHKIIIMSINLNQDWYDIRNDLLEIISYRYGAKMQVKCSFCGNDMDNPNFSKNYPNIVCRKCESPSVNSNGEIPQFDSMGDFGDNPVYINGAKCWRRYKFGGFITMRDDFNCENLDEFYDRSGFMKRYMQDVPNPIDVSKINRLLSQLDNDQMDVKDSEARQREEDRSKLLNEYFEMGVTASHNGEFEESALIFIKTLEYINNSQHCEKAQILFNIVTGYCKAGNFPTAAEYLSKLNSLSDEHPDNIVINEENAKGLCNIVKAAYYEAGDVPRAISYFSDLTSIVPRFSQNIEINLATANGVVTIIKAYGRNGDFSKADSCLSDLTSIASRFPHNIEINRAMVNGLFNIFISYINVGNFPEASIHLESLKRLVDTFSDNTYIQNTLTKAFEHYQQKIEKDSRQT